MIKIDVFDYKMLSMLYTYNTFYSKKIYLSGGDNGAVIVYDIEKFQRLDSISLNGEVDSINYEDSFTSDLLLNESSNELLVLDRGNFRMVRIDVTTKKITASIKTGSFSR